MRTTRKLLGSMVDAFAAVLTGAPAEPDAIFPLCITGGRGWLGTVPARPNHTRHLADICLSTNTATMDVSHGGPKKTTRAPGDVGVGDMQQMC